jgi:hypothetical protein
VGSVRQSHAPASVDAPHQCHPMRNTSNRRGDDHPDAPW